MAMIERRVSDGSILRLIRKWIHVGVIEDGRLLVSETGDGTGAGDQPAAGEHLPSRGSGPMVRERSEAATEG